MIEYTEPQSEYFIYAVIVDAPYATLVKLGRARGMRSRINSISVGCPYPVRRVYYCDVIDSNEGSQREWMMHDLYSETRVRGEWFSPWGRIATDEDLLGLERNVYDIARERLGQDPRSYRMIPDTDRNGNVRLREHALHDEPPKLVRDEDGYPINKPYAGYRDQEAPNVIITKRRRRFKRS